MSKQAEYNAFLDKIDNSVAGQDEYGTLRDHVNCSALANAAGEGEEMYASALQSAEMILDCWADYYPQLVKPEAEPEAEAVSFTARRVPGQYLMGTYDTRGGTPRHDPAADYTGACEICGHDPYDCICPECPVCGAQGDPKCYREHGLETATMQNQAAPETDAFGNKSVFIAEYWTEDDGWQDSDMEFGTREEAEDWCRNRPHWRYYDALEAHYAEVEAEMKREAEWASARTPECGCEWGCWRCEGEDRE